MVVLVDTNVILDVLTVREKYFKESKKVIELCASQKYDGYMAFHSIPNIYFIMRKEYSDERRRELLKFICGILTVTGASHDRVCDAIDKSDFKDFEDCLQEMCALQVDADYIVTRNVNDFVNSDIKAVTPEEFLQIIS